MFAPLLIISFFPSGIIKSLLINQSPSLITYKFLFFFIKLKFTDVSKFFDDVLVTATTSLPEKYIYKLEPWDLENLVPFEKSYLSGFVTEKYQIDLESGFDIAKNIMDPKIRTLIRRDIGGDVQRIISTKTRYNDITFKHLLLPVYVSAYRYKNKLYQFLVNGRTGEVQGQRPYSWIKITLVILVVIAIIAAIVFFNRTSE